MWHQRAYDSAVQIMAFEGRAGQQDTRRLWGRTRTWRGIIWLPVAAFVTSVEFSEHRFGSFLRSTMLIRVTVVPATPSKRKEEFDRHKTN